VLTEAAAAAAATTAGIQHSRVSCILQLHCKVLAYMHYARQHIIDAAIPKRLPAPALRLAAAHLQAHEARQAVTNAAAFHQLLLLLPSLLLLRLCCMLLLLVKLHTQAGDAVAC
jgi:hypothetical protein